MKNKKKHILVLGGTSEAKQIASKLFFLGHEVTYSLCNPVYTQCSVGHLHIGAWKDEKHLSHFLKNNNIDLLVDMTHPYAQKISQIAQNAALDICDFFSYARAPWAFKSPLIYSFETWNELFLKISKYQYVLFALGKSIFPHFHQRKKHQHWIIRCINKQPKDTLYCHFVQSFCKQNEFDLFPINVLVCKNSGGEQGKRKIENALKKNIPVFMQKRPKPIHCAFDDYKKFQSKLTQYLISEN